MKEGNVSSSGDMNNTILVGVGIVSNILSVVGVVITNKYITEVDGMYCITITYPPLSSYLFSVSSFQFSVFYLSLCLSSFS